MTYDARRAALKIQKHWIDSCKESLCYVYKGGWTQHAPIKENCAHQWCHGILDVLNRSDADPTASYRIPDENDEAWTRETEKWFKNKNNWRPI